MPGIQKITPCLWFDDQAEQAVETYCAIFNDSKVLNVSYFGEAGYAIHGKKAGTVMSIAFELDGVTFTAINGGPQFQFNEAISFQVNCHTQQEVDYYWAALSESGDKSAQQCGWLKDKFGVSWQVIPVQLDEMLRDPDNEKSQRVMLAMLEMKKIDLEKLQQAYLG